MPPSDDPSPPPPEVTEPPLPPAPEGASPDAQGEERWTASADGLVPLPAPIVGARVDLMCGKTRRVAVGGVTTNPRTTPIVLSTYCAGPDAPHWRHVRLVLRRHELITFISALCAELDARDGAALGHVPPLPASRSAEAAPAPVEPRRPGVPR